MKIIFRIITVVVVFPITYWFLYWIPCGIIFSTFSFPMDQIISLLGSALFCFYVWRKMDSAPESLISNVFFGASVIGITSFLLGFIGPMIFSPAANQGPLLGILITGPLGFIVGGVGGLIYWLLKRSKTVQSAKKDLEE